MRKHIITYENVQVVADAEKYLWVISFYYTFYSFVCFRYEFYAVVFSTPYEWMWPFHGHFVLWVLIEDMREKFCFLIPIFSYVNVSKIGDTSRCTIMWMKNTDEFFILNWRVLRHLLLRPILRKQIFFFYYEELVLSSTSM